MTFTCFNVKYDSLMIYVTETVHLCIVRKMFITKCLYNNLCFCLLSSFVCLSAVICLSVSIGVG